MHGSLQNDYKNIHCACMVIAYEMMHPIILGLNAVRLLQHRTREIIPMAIYDY